MVDDLDRDVAAAQGGDAHALERVLVAVQDDVHRLALRMTGCPDDALDATQEILIKVMTRLASFAGDSAFRTWVFRVAVNHLLDRKKSTVERLEMTFDLFAEDLASGLAPVATQTDPDRDILAREVKHSCTLALLSCLERDLRVAYVLGEVFAVSSAEGAWICDISDTAYRKRLSRARATVRSFVADHCGLVSPGRVQCHCRRRVETAVALDRVDATVAETASPAEVDAATEEIETLYDVASLIRSVPDGSAPEAVPLRIRALVRSGRYRLLDGGADASGRH